MKDLSKRKLGLLSRVLEDEQAVFRARIERLAEQARSEILPYFRRHDLDYRAGNGTWIISKPATDGVCRLEDPVEDEALPPNIRELLTLEVAHGDCLGFYVRDIRRGEW